MANKKKEKVLLNKDNWLSSFNLEGEVRISDKNRDNVFNLDQVSEKSNWQYSRLNLPIFCGDECGTVYVNAMGGFGIDRDNVIYVHGKDDEGRDDFSNQFTIAWEDREDESIIEEIGKQCFYSVGIETDAKKNIVWYNFLSEYDMIQYLADNLTDGMVVRVSGKLEYQEYNGNINCTKSVQRISLIKDPNPDNYHASFTQSVLIDKDSKGDVDKDKNVIYIDAYILEYFKEYNGYNLAIGDKKGQFVPLRKQFEYKFDPANKELVTKAVTKLFKPKKGVSQITFVGQFVESGGKTVAATLDDLPEDIQTLVACGVYTEEEALADCADNGGRERRMILIKPLIKKITNDDGSVTATPQIFEEKYSDDDLDLEFLTPKNEEFEDVDEDEVPDDFMNEPEDESTDDDSSDLDWIDQL